MQVRRALDSFPLQKQIVHLVAELEIEKVEQVRVDSFLQHQAFSQLTAVCGEVPIQITFEGADDPVNGLQGIGLVGFVGQGIDQNV